MTELKFKARVHAMPSDLLEGKIKVTFILPLNDATPAMRSDFAMLKVMEEEVEVVVRGAQQKLPGMDAATVAANEFARSVKEGDEVTLSSGSKSVTVRGKGRRK